MSILLDLVRELLSFRTVRVNGADRSPRSALEFDAPVGYRDDPENDRLQLAFPFAPELHVGGVHEVDFEAKYAPAVYFIDGNAPAVAVTLPNAELLHGQPIEIVDLGSSLRVITLHASVGSLDYIDGKSSAETFGGVGASLRLIAFAGSLSRRPGWYVTSIRKRGV
jgi:hypothetical protein